MVDGTILYPLIAIDMDQANSTQDALQKMRKFMDCAATHPDAILTYRTKICYWHTTVAYHTQVNPRQEVMWEVIISCKVTSQSHQTMKDGLQMLAEDQEEDTAVITDMKYKQKQNQRI